jgi:hypothetical protein
MRPVRLEYMWLGGGTVTLITKRATAAVSPASYGGEFDAILSTPTVDRDGESLPSHAWKQPLPSSIAITADHTGSVADVVASGEPYLAADGSLRLRGRFAGTEKGQQIRQLVVGGHIAALSVEFLRSKAADGQPVHELTAASFVLLPANPEAKVLSAKAFDAAVKAIVDGKSADDAGAAMVQAIHDASAHLGAACMAGYADDDLSEDGEDGSADGANKAAALRLRLKAQLSAVSR